MSRCTSLRRQLYQGSKRYASVQSSAASTPNNPAFKIDLPRLNGHGPFAEKPVFEVIGSPFSLVNASIPSKAILYTRRGSLVGINGDARTMTSTLSVFSSGFKGTATRLLGGAPFLYQKLQASEPFTALVGTKSTATSFAVLELDGRFDWNLIAKDALLLWCGVKAETRQQGIGKSLLRVSTSLTGRGSAVVSGSGQIYQIVLEQGDSYILHPSNVLAYAESCPEPQQVKLQNLKISLPFKVPSLSNFLLKYEFFRVMSAQPFWTYTKRFGLAVRRFFRNLIWGDQLFVRFQGPTTILLQSRSGTKYTEEERSLEIEPIPDEQEPTKSDNSKTYSGSLKVASVENGRVTLTDTPTFTKY